MGISDDESRAVPWKLKKWLLGKRPILVLNSDFLTVNLSIQMRENIPFTLSLVVLFLCHNQLVAQEAASDLGPVQSEVLLPKEYQEAPQTVSTIPEVLALHGLLNKNWQKQVDAPFTTKVERLRNNYQNAIRKEAAKLNSAGDLSQSRVLLAEADSIKVGKPVPTGEVEGHRKLTDMRKLFHKTKTGYVSGTLAAQKSVINEFNQKLSTLSTQLGADNRDQDALMVSNWLTTLSGNDARKSSESGGTVSNTQEEVLTSFDSIVKTYPVQLNLIKSGNNLDPDQLEAVNEDLAKYHNRLVRWKVDLSKKDSKSKAYYSTHFLEPRSTRLTFGRKVLDTNVRVFYRDIDDFSAKRNGDVFEVVGRIGQFRVNDINGGIWALDICNAQLESEAEKDSDGNYIIAKAPHLKIIKANYGTWKINVDVTPAFIKRVIIEQKGITASVEQMGSDPAPYMQKSFRVNYELDGQPKKISGVFLKFDHFFR